MTTHTPCLRTRLAAVFRRHMARRPARCERTRYPVAHDPGTRWTYGESTRVLGRLVEAVSAQDLETFGLGFQITGPHDETSSRSPGSMSWAGIFNTEFWIDPEKGIGAVLLMQYLPFYDEAAIETLTGFEERVYQAFDD